MRYASLFSFVQLFEKASSVLNVKYEMEFNVNGVI